MLVIVTTIIITPTTIIERAVYERVRGIPRSIYFLIFLFFIFKCDFSVFTFMLFIVPWYFDRYCFKRYPTEVKLVITRRQLPSIFRVELYETDTFYLFDSNI